MAKQKPHFWPDAVGLPAALAHIGVALRWNLRKDSAEVQMPDREGWIPAAPRRVTAKIRELIRLNCYDKAALVGKKPNKTKPLTFGAAWNDAFNAVCYDVECDPFMDYLEGLKWDRRKRLDKWMTLSGFTFEKDSTPEINAWGQRAIVLGAVARTYKPGIKLDETPVLVSDKGGISKSWAISSLFSDENAHDWFTDGLVVQNDHKKMLEATLGKVIVELGEMAGILSGAKSDTVKVFLTTQNDNATRLAWRTDAESQPRRFICVGTCDTTLALPDEENLRRFAILHIADGNPAKMRKYMDANRDQIWAEAVARWKKGEHPRLPDELKQTQAAQNEQYRNTSELEVEMDAWLEKNGGPGKAFRLLEVARGVQAISPIDPLSRLPRDRQLAITKHLRRLGYTNKGKGPRFWRLNGD